MGSLPRPAYGDLGDVDRSNGPAALSEPDRVGAFAAANVERPARGKGGYLGDEPPVRSPAPHRRVTLAVPRIPLSGLRRRAKLLLAVFVLAHSPHGEGKWTPPRSSPIVANAIARQGHRKRSKATVRTGGTLTLESAKHLAPR
jgi:hypothetical protein